MRLFVNKVLSLPQFICVHRMQCPLPCIKENKVVAVKCWECYTEEINFGIVNHDYSNMIMCYGKNTCSPRIW